jgi:dipeptidyl-peptidase III
LIKFEFTTLPDGKEYFYMNIDRAQLRTTGHKALSDFLGKLHTLKSLGDFGQAEEWFNTYSTLDDEMRKVKDLVELHRKPRRLELQPNLFNADSDVEYRDYAESFEGIIQSYCERFEGDFLQDVYDEWKGKADQFRYK